MKFVFDVTVLVISVIMSCLYSLEYEYKTKINAMVRRIKSYLFRCQIRLDVNLLFTIFASHELRFHNPPFHPRQIKPTLVIIIHLPGDRCNAHSDIIIFYQWLNLKTLQCKDVKKTLSLVFTNLVKQALKIYVDILCFARETYPGTLIR